MREPNYRSRNGEIVASGFVDREHWRAVELELLRAGLDFQRFLGKRSALSVVRGHSEIISDPKRIDDLPGDDQTRLREAWDRSVTRLFDQSDQATEAVERAGFAFCPTGLAFALDEVVDVSQRDTLQYVGTEFCWASRQPEYRFVDQTAVVEHPISVTAAGFTILWR